MYLQFILFQSAYECEGIVTHTLQDSRKSKSNRSLQPNSIFSSKLGKTGEYPFPHICSIHPQRVQKFR